MGFNFFGLFEKKDYALNNPQLVELFGQSPTYSGVSVNAQSALSVPAFNAAVRVISESVAALPVHLYKRDGDTKTRDTDNPLYTIIHDTPNEWSSSYDFRLQMMIDCLLTGNAYAFVNRVGGTVREIVRLLPGTMTVTAGAGGEPIYKARNAAGVEQTYSFNDILHIKALSTDGLTGVSPIVFAREAIGLALSLERTHAALHANGAQPGGVLSVKGKLDQPARERLKAAWHNFQGGVSNRYKTAVLDVDAAWTPLAMTGVDSQHLETRRFQIEEISRSTRVPPHLLHEMSRATWGNASEMGQSFLDYCLLPWLKTWEGAMMRTLLTAEERKTGFIEFDASALTRTNLTARNEAYSRAIGGPWLVANEIRAMENRPPIEGGDILNEPQNSLTVAANDNTAPKKETIAA